MKVYLTVDIDVKNITEYCGRGEENAHEVLEASVEEAIRESINEYIRLPGIDATIEKLKIREDQ